MILKYFLCSIEGDESLTLPKFHLITTHIKTGYSCVEYYAPKKTLSLYALKKVIYYYFIIPVVVRSKHPVCGGNVRL